VDGGQGGAEPFGQGRDLLVQLLDAGSEGGDVGEAGGQPIKLDLIGTAEAVVPRRCRWPAR
jgi:hypothetical protein